MSVTKLHEWIRQYLQAYTKRCRTFSITMWQSNIPVYIDFPGEELSVIMGNIKEEKLSYPIRLISLQIQNKAAANETKHNI